MSFDEWSNSKKKKKTSSFEEWSNAERGISKKQEEEDERKRQAYLAKQSDDIAPVSGRGGDKNSWFKSGGFSDGVDGVGDFFGDLGETVLGTAADLGIGVVKGAGRMVEGLADLGTYGVAKAADALGADEFAEKAKRAARYSATDEWTKGATDFVDQYSILGNKADMVSEGLGQVGAIILTGGVAGAAGLGGAGVAAVTTGVTGLSSMGTNMGQAYDSGATDKDAFLYGLSTGAIEAGTELLFGGLGKTVKALGISRGIGGLDDIFAKKLASKIAGSITNEGVQKALGNTIEYAVKSSGEGLEEVLSGLGSAVMKKLTYEDDESLKKLIADENLLEQFVVGAVTSSIAQGADFVKATKSGTDLVTGHTAADEKVVSKVVEDEIARREKAGETLSTKDKNEIYDAVVEQMEHGQIDIDTIEEVLGGDAYKEYRDTVETEDALKTELADLRKMKSSDMNDLQVERMNELKGMNLADTTKRDGLRKALDDTLSPMLQNSKLSESYRERERRGQKFEADLSKYNGKQRAAVERAVQSGVLNNTYRSHELVDVLSKIEAEKGIVFDYTNNAKLKDSGFAVDGKTVNGFANKNKGTVTLNVQSNKAWQFVVGHEITHVLETNPEAYNALRESLYAYAESKGELESRRAATTALYDGMDADIEAELTADLVGDYLFTDKDFVKHLTGNRTMFQKIYDEIKYLWNKATGKEKTEIEKVKDEFDRVWKEFSVKGTSDEISGENSAEVSDVGTENVQYSIREEDPPKKTIKGYKVFRVVDGKLYPPMVDNPSGNGTPVGVWLNADIGGLAHNKDGSVKLNTEGRFAVESSQGGSLSFRPGWHLGEYPDASQFGRMDTSHPLTDEELATYSGKTYKDKKSGNTYPMNLFPYNFVWAECDVAADRDYQLDAMSLGVNDKGSFVRSRAGLPYVPADGYYKYRTNPDPNTAPWIISGAIKVNRILDDAEVAEICAQHGVTPQTREGYTNLKKKDGGSRSPGNAINLADFGLASGEVAPTDATALAEIYAAEGVAKEQSATAMSLLKTLPGYAKRKIDFADEKILNEFAMNNQDAEYYRNLAESTGDGYLVDDKLYSEESGKVQYSVSPDSIDSIEKKYKDKTDYLFITERKNGTISIDNMVVKEAYRNRGIGTSILNDVIAYADANGKTITLTPTSEFGTKAKLTKWYKANGFVENKGKNADYTLSDTMYRLPKKGVQYSVSDLEGKTLYTGSPNTNIQQFKVGGVEGSRQSGDRYGRGVYLTTNKNTAKGYAGDSGKVYEINADRLNIFNLNDPITDEMKATLQRELNGKDKQFRNSVLRNFRSEKAFTDFDSAEQFFDEQRKLWKAEDGYYAANKPDIKSANDKTGEAVIEYTDFANIDNAIGNLTGNELYDALKSISTDDFASFITGHGFDGISFDEDADNQQYVIYRNEDRLNIINNDIAPTPDVQYSISPETDADYMSAVERGDTETAQRMVDEAARNSMPNSKVRGENGNLHIVYHGSPSKFTVFDHSKLNAHGNSHGRGFYFTEDRGLAESYETNGGQLLKGYLNIEKPLSEEKITIKKADLVKLIKATCEGEAQLLVDEGGYDSIREAILDTWVSNYADTYGTRINDVYKEVADIIYSGNENDVDIIAEITNSGAGNEIVLKKTYEVLGYDGVIYTNEATGKHEYVALVSNQFKSADPVTYDDNGNVIPLSQRFNEKSDDIRNSLSNENESFAPVGNYSTPFRELAYGDDIAPTPKTVRETPKTEGNTSVNSEVYAPVTEEEADALSRARFDAITDADAPPETPAPYYGEDRIEPSDPFEKRDMKAVGSQKVKAYMYENPEVKPFFQQEAEVMLGDLYRSQKGERVVDAQTLYDTNGEAGVWGVSRHTSPEISELLDEWGYTYAEIEKGLKAIIEDNGKENNACSKRIEFMLNDRLMKGYEDFDGGFDIPANQDYINLVAEKEITEYNEEAWKRLFGDIENHIPPVDEEIAPTPKTVAEAPMLGQIPILPDDELEDGTHAAIRPEKKKPVAPKSERIADGSRSDELLYDSLDNHPVQTIEQKIAEKIRALHGELADRKDLRREKWDDYESRIADLRAKYNAKKNKNTKEASKILQSISRLERMKASDDADFSKRIGDLEARIQKMSDPKYGVAMQKRAKMEADAKWAADLLGDTSTWVDKKIGLQYATNTERRNLRDIVRDENGNVDIAKADAIDDALNGQYNRDEAAKKRELANVRGKYADLGITKAEDAYIQMLGELRHNPDTSLTELDVTEYYEKHRDKIDTAKVDMVIEMARQDYDDFLNRVNAELKKQGMKEIPYRQGYFPHFTEPKQNFIQKLLNWKVQDNEIPTSIAGLTETFKPTRSWQSFDKRRYSDETDYSFMKGFDSYSEGALDWIYHMDTLQKRRAVENHIRYTHSDEGISDRIKAVYASEDIDANEAQAQIEHILSEAKNPLNNFVQDFTTHTNILAGKKNSLDRTVEQWTNRHIYSVMTNVQNRMSANMVLANVRSAMTNFIPITQSWAQVSPLRSLQAVKQTIANSIKDDGTVDKSTFLTNRLREVDKLYQTNWDKVLDKAGIMFEIVDNISSQVIWRSKYNQNLADGMTEAQAIRNADQFAENVMAGRSKGNEPTLFNAKNPFVKAFTMFQLEVNNQYGYLFKDVPNDLKAETEHWRFNLAKGYTAVFVGAYIYNALLEKVTGSDAALDPIGIVEELLRDLGLLGDDEEEEPEKIVTNLVGNVVEELPFVGGVLGGGRIPISSAIPYGGEYGGGLSGFVEDVGNIGDGGLKNIGKEMMNPILNVGLPVGGGQIKKSVQGLKMFSDDHPVTGSYTDSGKLRFPVEDTMLNKVQAAVFGQYASKNAREYFDGGYAPLSEKQIQEYIDVDIPIKDYWEYREGLNGKTKAEEKMDYISGLDLPMSKKNILANNALDRKDPVDLTNYEDFGSLEEFDYATKNPEKYALAKSVGGYSAYKKYSGELYDIKADKDASGKSITGSRKEKVIEYINNLDADYYAKIILYKSEYPSDDTYNYEIVNHINNRSDMSYDERIALLTELGFRVTADGKIYAD